MKHKLVNLGKQLALDKWLLLLCFVLSFFAWQAIRRNIGFEPLITNIAIEVETPDGWAVLEKSLDIVDARFRGSREDIRYLNRDQLRIVVPVKNPKRGETLVIPLDPKFVKNNPTGAKVTRFSTSKIEIKLDKEIQKDLPVKAKFESVLPDGIEKIGTLCKPLTVRIKGAEQQLLKMEYVYTEAIDLHGRQESFKDSVHLILPQEGRLVAESDRVTVQVTLKEDSVEKVFEEIPIRIYRAAEETRPIQISPQSISVTVRGKQQQLELLQPRDITVYADCSELPKNGSYKLELRADLPQGVSWVKTTNEVVNVQYTNSN